MVDGIVGGADAAPPCPLCNGTRRRRIHHPGTPRRQSVLVDCTCALTKDDPLADPKNGLPLEMRFQ